MWHFLSGVSVESSIRVRGLFLLTVGGCGWWNFGIRSRLAFHIFGVAKVPGVTGGLRLRWVGKGSWAVIWMWVRSGYIDST